MSTLTKPVKTLIVNSTDETQINFYTLDAGGTRTTYEADTISLLDGDLSQGYIKINGFLTIKSGDLRLLDTAVRIRKTVGTVGVAQVATLTIPVGTNMLPNDVWQINRYIRRVLGDVVSQQQLGDRKITQIKNTQPTTIPQNDIATKIAATLNREYKKEVVATVVANVITITAIDRGVDIAFNVTDNIGTSVADLSVVGTFVVTVPASAGINNYDTLRNVKMSNNMDQSEFNQLLQEYPVRGALYTSYYFETLTTPVHTGSADIMDANIGVSSRFKLYVNNACTTAIAFFDALLADVNV